MKTRIPLLLLLALGTHLAAGQRIVGIPRLDLQSAMPELAREDQARTIARLGYGVLYYDNSQLIAIEPALPDPMIPASAVADYPPDTRLYLVAARSNAERELGQAGSILLELDSGCLIASEWDETELAGLIRYPFSPLNLEPLRLAGSRSALALPADSRNVVTDLVNAVSIDSVLVKLQYLQDFLTRYALAENRLQVAEGIRQIFLNYGLADAQLQPFSYNNTTQYNVIATLPGTEYPNEYVIVGGHHDSRSNDGNQYLFAPGADDNASGTVATLEMARVLTQSGFQPKASIRFVTFAAEEVGLKGSTHYAQNAVATGQNIRLMINHDMIANQDSLPDWQVRLMPYDGCLQQSAFAAGLTSQFTALETYYGYSNSPYSDSYPFWSRGYPAIYFFEDQFSPYYHSTQDLVANLNPSYCAEVIRASLACAVAFADMPAVPATPEDLSITRAGPDFQLTWSAVTESTLGVPLTASAYNVYFSALPDAGFVLLGTTPDLFYTCTPPVPEPDSMFFKVQAVVE